MKNELLHICIGRPKLNSANGVMSFIKNFALSLANSKLDNNILYYKKRKWFYNDREVSLIMLPSILNNKTLIFHGFYYSLFIFLYLLIIFNKNSVSKRIFIYAHGSFGKISLKKSWLKKQTVIYIYKFLNSIKRFNIIALNENEKDDISVFFDGEYISVLYPISKTNCAIQKKFKKRSHLKLVYIGRYDYYNKGLDRLINLFSSNIGCDISLFTYGPKDSYGSDAYKFSNESKSIKNINVENAIFGVEKNKIIADADYLILPSRSEGFPTVVLESLSLSTPCIVSKECNIPIDYNNNGVHIIDFEDTKLVVNFFRDICNNPGQKYDDSSFAVELFNKNLSSIVLIPTYEKFFSDF